MRSSGFPAVTVVLCLPIAVTLVAPLAHAEPGFRPSVQGKKLIASGWHVPGIKVFREKTSELEKLPYDGAIIGSFYPFWQGFRGQQGALEEFVADAKATPFKRFTDNFIGVESGNDGGFDWFDEARCSEMVANWGRLAKAAKEAGFAGVKFDPECYEGPSPFEYTLQQGKETRTVQEYAARAEVVGGQVMRAINEHYPNMIILLYFGPSAAGDRSDLTKWCGLIPGFVDGMLREAQPGFVIVDGFEQAYGFRQPQQYAAGREKMKSVAMKASPVPRLFADHVQAGFAVWPDNWHGDPGIKRTSFRCDDLERNYYTPVELAYAVHNALAYADKYVWQWAESFDPWNARAMVFDEPGKWTWQSVPEAFMEALGEGRKASVATPPARDLGPTMRQWKAADLGPVDDETVFAGLWDQYRFVADLPLRWRFRTDPEDAGAHRGWASRDFDHRQWPLLRIRALWDEQAYAGYLGYAWYRVWCEAPQLPPGKRAYLVFGSVDESAWVHVNGRLCGVHDTDPDVGFQERFLVDVTGALRPGQRSLIAVRVRNTIGVGGIWRNVKLVTER
jgi:hypothetical protein